MGKLCNSFGVGQGKERALAVSYLELGAGKVVGHETTDGGVGSLVFLGNFFQKLNSDTGIKCGDIGQS